VGGSQNRSGRGEWGPALNQTSMTHPHILHFQMNFNVASYLCLGFPSGKFSSGFLANIYTFFLTYPMHETCHSHLLVLGVITIVNIFMIYVYRNVMFPANKKFLLHSRFQLGT